MGDEQHIVDERGYEPRMERHRIILDRVNEYGDIGSVLDVASGHGEFLERLERENESITGYGVDIDEELLRTTNKKTSAQCVRADGQYLPFDSDTVDMVTAIGIIEHVENPTQFVRDVHRVARKYAVFVTPNLGRPNRLIAAAKKDDITEFTGHKQGWDYHLLRRFLEMQGWSVETIEVRLVDFPLYRYFPRLGRYLSYKMLPHLVPRVGSELFAFCEVS